LLDLEHLAHRDAIGLAGEVDDDELVAGDQVVEGFATAGQFDATVLRHLRLASLAQTCRRTAEIRSSASKGLVRYSVAPCFMPQKRSASWSLEVTMMIGRSAQRASRRIWRQSWKPFLPGRTTSSSSRSISSVSRRWSPSSPLEVRTT